MKRSFGAIALAVGLLAAQHGQAATINSSYTSLGSNLWTVDFSIVNDGMPALFAGFTVHFPNATNLTVVASPTRWDSLAVQAEPGLPDDAFFDTFAMSSADYVAAGATQAGFRVSFSYAGGTPGSMPFSINAADFTPLALGSTTVVAVPEPATALLAAFGIGALGFVASRRRKTIVATEVSQ